MTTAHDNNSLVLSLAKGHHHQFFLLLVEHRASMRRFQALRSPAIPSTSFHDFLYFLFHPLLSLATFSSAYLFFCTPEDSNLMRFSLLLLLLYIMCVQSNSIFSLLSEYGTHIPSSPFTPCGAQGTHVELPSVVISSYPLDLIP
jgi:hypothetical protein